MKRLVIWVPLILFAGLFALAAVRLTQPKDEIITSKMIGQQLPAIELAPIVDRHPGIGVEDIRDGRPKLLNIFASWCPPCAAEAPHLEQLERSGAIIYGVANRDTGENIANFLARFGDPYDRIGADPRNQLSLELGASGVPETYVIGGDGTILYQHIGDVRAEDVPELLAKLEEAR